VDVRLLHLNKPVSQSVSQPIVSAKFVVGTIFPVVVTTAPSIAWNRCIILQQSSQSVNTPYSSK